MNEFSKEWDTTPVQSEFKLSLQHFQLKELNRISNNIAPRS